MDLQSDSNHHVQETDQTQIMSLLFVAVEHNRKETVEFLMETLIKHKKDSDGVTPLMIAIREGNVKILNLLLNEKIPHSNLGEKDIDERNVLHYAFQSQNSEEVFQKLEEFCSVNRGEDYIRNLFTEKDANGDTPLHILVQIKHEGPIFSQVFTCLRATDSDKDISQIH